jgi:FkbM family methyltransferase
MKSMKELRNRIRLAWYGMRGFYPFTMDGHRFKGNPENWRYWRNIRKGKWEPHTLKILSSMLSADGVFLDIGAFIGPTAIYAAKHCKRVYCLEPDPYAYEGLLKTLRLNKLDNVVTMHAGLYHEEKVLAIGGPKGLGTSGSSLLFGDQDSAVFIYCTTLEKVMDIWKIPSVALMKIDIEGAEFEVIPRIVSSILRCSEGVYISTHAPHFPEGERAVKMQMLVSLFEGYQYIYDQALQPIKPADILQQKYLDDYCEFLCSNKRL